MLRFAILAALAVLAAPALAEPQTATLGPFTRVQTIEGVDVAVPVRVELSRQPGEGHETIKARVVADLSDLVAKIGPILDRAKLPSDNCKAYGADNPVVTLSAKELSVRDSHVALRLAGAVQMWECIANPVPHTRLETRTRTILGVRTRVMELVPAGTSNPLKTVIVTQPFEAVLPLALARDSDHSVSLHFGRPNIALKGQYAFITKAILRAASVDVNAKAESALLKAIKPDALRLAVPSLPGFDPVVEGAGFLTENGHLVAEVKLSAEVSPLGAITLIQQLTGAIRARN